MMLTWLEYKKIRLVHFGELRVEARKNYNKYLKEKMKKSIWPYTEMYKGNEMHVFRDGSVDIVEHDFICADLTEAFKYIDEKEKMNYPTTSVCCFSLAPCTTTACPPVPCQKGNNPMYVDNDKHIESSKINYLSDRVNTVYYRKADSLSKVFGFTDDESPQTSQELVDRFVSGKFVFRNPEKKDTKGFFYRPLENIQWRDPASKEDQVGYDAANAALKTLYQDTKDTIAIGTPADGLAAVKALDAWTPTIATA